MIEYLISFTMAFILAFSATPVARRLAFRWGAVDVPKDNRRMHKKPTPRLGGLAIVVSFIVTVLFFVVTSRLGMDSVEVSDKKLFGMIIGVLIMLPVLIRDDIKALSPLIKFVVQIAAALVVAATGTRILVVTNPFAEAGMTVLPAWFSVVLTVLWIVGITNAINFIDGLDGLAAGVASIASLSLFLVSLITRDLGAALLTSVLAGSTLGFLPYNFNPAKIFMGDTGSNFLGFALAVVSVQSLVKSYTAIALAIPILVLGLPIFDTLFAIIRRLVQGKSPLTPDRGHLHHRLVDMGLSHKQSVLVMYIVSAVLGLSAIVLAEKGVLSAIILVIAVSVFVIGGARYMTETAQEATEEDTTGELDKGAALADEPIMKERQ